MLVARKIDSSRANGPGNRAVVWFQGCEARCPGCCNPELQPMESDSAKEETATGLAYWFLDVLRNDEDVRGLTLSGGEPLMPSRLDEVLLFIGICRAYAPRPFDVLVFTGIRWSCRPRDLPGIDMLIAGPYEREYDNQSGIVSSTNQEIVRLTGGFMDVSNDELLNGKRIIEVRMVDDTVTVTGLSSIEDTMEALGLD
jgi:anaerobic ribonucleoside-triphosphate reductase activating protein